MSIRKIETTPSPVLRQKAKEVGVINKKIKKLIADMTETMTKSSGIGIAAPQVGESIRLIVVELKGGKRSNGEEMPKFPLTVCINPKITKCSKETEISEEGCLSVPDIWGSVERFKEVEVLATNEKGENIKIKASGLVARVFQHEIDHLEGVLYTDRVDYKTLHKINSKGEKIPFEI
ncbi:peptide deformylase [bacterium]|nr:peptide deformylase [bacterium]